MLMRSLEICNFRQFYGTQYIEFSTDPDKNITLIHAENGVGKTALLNTILWCLYEKTTKNFEGEIQNEISLEQGKKTYYVYLTFEEDGRKYVAQRTLDPLTKRVVFKVYEILISGNHKALPNPEIFINSVVPKDMSDYFFFKGEGDETISVNSGAKIKEAIRDILGLTIAERVLNDLDKVRTSYRREFNNLDSSQEIKEIQKKLEQLESENQTAKSELDDEKTTRDNLVAEVKRLQDVLRNSDHEIVKQKQEERETKQETLQSFKKIRDDLNKRKVDLIRKYAVSAFSHTASQKGIDFIDEKNHKKHSHKISSPHSEGLVDDIIKSETCICGREIKVGTSFYGNIKKLLQTAGDPRQENRIRRARSQLTVVKKDLKTAEEDFRDVMDQLETNNNVISGIEIQLESLSNEIRGLNQEDVSGIEISLQREAQRLQMVNEKIGSIKTKREENSQKITNLRTQEARFESSSKRVIQLRKTISFIGAIYDDLSQEIQNFEKSSKLRIAQKINDFLDLYARKNFTAKINENYEIILFDQNDRVVNKSDGEKLLLGLTFISSLISFAKDRKNASGTILTPGAIAPFVVDAPFGDLDKSYKKSVASELPKSVNQMVLLLSSSHWEGEVEQAIRNRVGKEYNIVFHEPSERGPKPESSISILDKKYPTVRYSAEIKMSSIEEVSHAG
jgi:DNA sulfur modification protein DndD